ncbi:hypothetical protein Tco_0866557 [Tanacetum coccineum]
MGVTLPAPLKPPCPQGVQQLLGESLTHTATISPIEETPSHTKGEKDDMITEETVEKEPVKVPRAEKVEKEPEQVPLILSHIQSLLSDQ